ncbi:ATP-dependent DNA helicase Q-like 5 [Selaginella moellendorffii]|nr:ATP-dependent DNA helicase Q-like 5 [Selaginella moellendorffii]|eukprot:XP_002973918.2 ATP-dependent DNA helicase Q-like 5 [Selaginella moellendorffii]
MDDSCASGGLGVEAGDKENLLPTQQLKRKPVAAVKPQDPKRLRVSNARGMECSSKEFSGILGSELSDGYSSRILHSGMVINVQRCGQRSESEIQAASLRFGGKRTGLSLGGVRAPLERSLDSKVTMDEGDFGDVTEVEKRSKRAPAVGGTSDSSGKPKVSQNSAGNFVKLNINGKGRKNRKFLNRASSGKKSSYRGRRRSSFKKKDRDNAVDEGKDQIWEDDGWCDSGNGEPLQRQDEACLPDEALAALKDPTDQNLLKVLRSVFGYGSFRKGQVETIRCVLSGQSTMLVLSTGAGKSLCYQLAAYLLPGTTLVISPLLALMVDQLRHLPSAIPGALINSTQSAKESLEVLEQVRTGAVKVLFISPERLYSESFLSVLTDLPSISLAVVDEAHCVSEWSHNFRPSYYRLGSVLRNKVKPKCVLAMTATATRKTKDSVLSSLGISSNNVLNQPEVPQNLVLTVSRCETNKLHALAQLLNSSPFVDAQSIIIYVKFQNEADLVCNYLQSKGLLTDSYHAGRTLQTRREVQEKFCLNKLRVVVATVAFGMGLDKSDVRGVIHYSIPSSPEHYVQEIGRAGRDGKPAFCHLFLENCSYLKLRSLAHSDGADEYAINKLLSRIFGSGRGLQSLNIEQACRELDLKEEVIATVLSYLEVGEEQHLRVLSSLKATCILHFHKGSPHVLARSNAFCSAVLERKQEKNGGYTLNLPSLTAEMKVTLMQIQKELQALQTRGEIAYELKDPAFCYQVLESPDDICMLTSKLADYLSQAESCKVRKLDAMYNAAALSVGPSAESPIRASIKAYFDSSSDQQALTMPGFLKTTSSFLRADVKVFLRSNEMDFTGRAIARIFHGLGSPMYPASSWSRNHFWGRHMDVDFYAIREVATAELLACRSSKR